MKPKKISVSFETEAIFEERPYKLSFVRKGSLVFSVPVKDEKIMHEYERDGVERKFPYCDYELVPVSDWNYAYVKSALEAEERGVSDIPFSSVNPPVVIKAQVRKIDWGYEDGYDTVCSKLPQSTDPVSEQEEILLCPYGSAKLRMTELPFVE